MATVKPVRTSYLADAVTAVWWEIAGIPTSLVRSADGFLRVGKDAVTGQLTRAAIKFPSTMPAWTSIGTIVEQTPVFHMFVDKRVRGSAGGTTFSISRLGAAWSEASTVADMEGTVVPTAAETVSGLIAPNRGWAAYELLFSSFDNFRTYGLLIEIDGANEQEIYIRTTPAARCSFHFGYTFSDALDPDSEARTTPSASAMRAIEGRDGHVAIETAIASSDVMEGEADVDFPRLSGAARSAIMFTGGGWPDSWTIEGGNRGGLSMPEPDVVEDALQWRGLELTQEITACPEGAASEVIGGSRSLVKSALAHQSGLFEVGVEDLLLTAFARSTYRRNYFLGFENVNWLNEDAISIAMDIILGGAGLRWQHIFYDDWVWLSRRFGAVWPVMTLDAATVAAGTVSSLLAAVAKRYSFCVSRTALGKVSLWHPAAWRPSFRVHDLDLDLYETADMSLSVLDDQAPVRGIVCENAGAEHGHSFGPAILDPGYDLSDSSVDLGVVRGNDMLWEETRDAICEQYAQRACTSRQILKGILPPANIQVQRGDQIRVTSTRWNLSATPFLVLSTELATAEGQQDIQAVHYPEAWGLHSCFSSGEVQGIYRWLNWDGGAFDYSNMAWEGSAGDFTATDAPSSHDAMAWEGPVLTGAFLLTGPNGFGCTDTASVCDLVDTWWGIAGNQNGLVGGGGVVDDNYEILTSWGKSGSANHALCIGIYRPEDHTYGRSAVRNKWFIGFTRNRTAIPIKWDWISYSYPGISRNWTGDPYDTRDMYAVGVQWQDSTITLYINGLVAVTHAQAKTGFDRFYLEGGEEDSEGECQAALGTLRWLKRTTGATFETKEMFTRHGIDPWYK